MKLKIIGSIFACILAQSSIAATTIFNINVVNNTVRSFNLISDFDTNTISPIIDGNGGVVNWSYSANSNILSGIKVFYSSIGDWSPCTNESRTGYIALNPNHYKNDIIYIVVKDNNDEDEEGLICSCEGSACDLGFK